MASPELDETALLPRLTEEKLKTSDEEMTQLKITTPELIEGEFKPPTTVVFENIKSHECDNHKHTHTHSSETFKSITNTYNNLDRQGKSRILPYLLGWMNNYEKFYISIKRKESEYTDETNRIIDSFNLQSEYKRRKLFPKIVAYFELLELDYYIIQDDNWKTPYIQKNTE